MGEMKRRFGPMPDGCPIVGQGTWQMAEGRKNAAEIEALRCWHRARPDPHRHRRDVTAAAAAEELIADAIRGIPRRDLFIVSKVLPHNAGRAGTAARVRADPAPARHRPPRRVPAALARPRAAGRDAGRARRAGRPGQDSCARRARTSTSTTWKRRGRCCASTRSPATRSSTTWPSATSTWSWCRIARTHDIAVVGYSPFGHGRFPSPSRATGRALAAVAARHDATPRQVALAFLARAAPLFTIPKASTVAHAEENAGALNLALDARRRRRDRRDLSRPRLFRAANHLALRRRDPSTKQTRHRARSCADLHTNDYLQAVAGGAGGRFFRSPRPARATRRRPPGTSRTPSSTSPIPASPRSFATSSTIRPPEADRALDAGRRPTSCSRSWRWGRACASVRSARAAATPPSWSRAPSASAVASSPRTTASCSSASPPSRGPIACSARRCATSCASIASSTTHSRPKRATSTSSTSCSSIMTPSGWAPTATA